MKYFKITCSNGYCGCEEAWYEEADDDAIEYDFDLDDYLQGYAFLEPDSRFGDDYETKEEYEEAYAEYQTDIYVDIEEITREEYEANA